MRNVISGGKFILFWLFGALIISCQTPTVTNPNTSLPASSNSSNVSANQTSLPPEFSATPLPLSGTTPGIPAAENANVQINSKKTASTPGIPPANKINPEKTPSGTSTPGIPDVNKMSNSSNKNLANSNIKTGEPSPKTANFNKNQ